MLIAGQPCRLARRQLVGNGALIGIAQGHRHCLRRPVALIGEGGHERGSRHASVAEVSCFGSPGLGVLFVLAGFLLVGVVVGSAVGFLCGAQRRAADWLATSWRRGGLARA